MGFEAFKLFKGVDGDVAIDPDKAYFVLGEAAMCHVHVSGGVVILVQESANQVATALWGYTDQVGTGYINPNCVVAMSTLNADRCRLHFTKDDFADLDMPVRTYIEARAFTLARRAELDRQKS